ncbi:chain length-determining protein [Rhodanobacter sp. Root627]|uniref:XrtA system polysaccharide chain length determinant n=1 Tax=Rhodanobacter sp. Root627 TaxID=1736572 RepID=UPI0006F4F2D4|nr:XrtA system polysaccharide chain length determinant [Rhodanobacter sp. Root627]KRA33144.1 chain length-determining protein [Rhodanobacter sp. Root627]
MQTESFDLQELFQYVLQEARAAWRYRWRALVVAWCVMVVGALLVFSLANKYESSAQVYADTDALTSPLLHGVAVQPDVRARLQVVTHTLLSRPNLETVADKTGLSLRASTPADKAALLLKLGKDVQIRDAGTSNLYDLTYSDSDREMSQKVVQAFLQILMSETVGANSASTATAQNFLAQQVEDYGKRLSEAETKLADFQKANLGYIPSQGGSTYFTRLQAAEAQLQALQAQYDTAVAGRVTTQQQMRAMATGSTSAGVDPRTQEIDSQIATYQQKLNTLLLSYTDEYPDVTATRRMIEQLKARRASLQKNVASGSMMGVVSDNPVYQEMQKSMYTTQVNIQTLATQIGLQKQQIAQLKGAADKITDVQATLQQLTRNYDVTKKQYDQLLERLNTAQLSQDATQSGNNLKFRVISPPLVPLLPVSPNRGLLLLVVFVFAVGMGGGFAYLLHKITPVFLSIRDLQSFGDYPVLGGLSLIVSRLRRREQRREAFSFFAGAGLLPMALMLAFAFDGTLSRLVQHFLVMGVV